MYRIFLVFVFLFSFSNSYSQKKDSLYVIEGDNGWLLHYKVKTSQTLASLAQQFHVPPALLSETNNMNLEKNVAAGSKVYIPIGSYNLASARQIANAQPIYYISNGADNFRRIARYSKTSSRAIQELNNYYYYEMYKGQILLVGWVLHDANTIINKSNMTVSDGLKPTSSISANNAVTAQKNVIYVVDGDTIRPGTQMSADTLSEGEQLFQQQTYNGESVTEEKGTAAFFNRTSRNSSGIYFAFHNTAKKGTIIKVYNPGTRKTIYAKVIGTVPTTPNFHNAIIGLSTDAKKELLVPGDKAWCELSYAP